MNHVASLLITESDVHAYEEEEKKQNSIVSPLLPSHDHEKDMDTDNSSVNTRNKNRNKRRSYASDLYFSDSDSIDTKRSSKGPTLSEHAADENDAHSTGVITHSLSSTVSPTITLSPPPLSAFKDTPKDFDAYYPKQNFSVKSNHLYSLLNGNSMVSDTHNNYYYETDDICVEIRKYVWGGY